MEPISITVGLIVGGGLGMAFQAYRSAGYMSELHDRIDARDETIAGYKTAYRILLLNFEKLRTARAKSNAPLRAANAKRKAAKQQRENEQAALRNQVHAELRASVEGLI